MKKKIRPYSLYLVTSEEYTKTKSTLDVARQAIRGGIDILQMREKTKPREELLSLGKKLAALCKENKAIFIVNDDPYLAEEVNADGVHLGQEDIKRYGLETVRSIVGKDKIIGISTHSIEQFKKASELDCDYMSFGPIFPTLSKDYSIGTSDIQEVAAFADKPVVFIGGINLANVNMVLEKGAKVIGVIRAITESDNPENAAEILKRRLHRLKRDYSD